MTHDDAAPRLMLCQLFTSTGYSQHFSSTAADSAILRLPSLAIAVSIIVSIFIDNYLYDDRQGIIRHFDYSNTIRDGLMAADARRGVCAIESACYRESYIPAITRAMI